MTKQAEFEEKTFEKYFGHELDRVASVTFSPGQRAEFHLGFDEAFRVPWPILRWRFPHLMPGLWSRMPGVRFGELDEIAMEVSDHLPPFRFNFFAQYKRPQYVAGPRGAERSDWGSPYYRYVITPHQQDALVRLFHASAGRAAVVYASPAFWRNETLFGLAAKRRVISRSNIASVERLVGHGCFTYVSPGGHGKAHSEVEDVDGPGFEEILQQGLEQPAMPFRDYILKTAVQIGRSMEDDGPIRTQVYAAREAIFSMSDADSRGRISPDSFAHALATIEAYCDVLGLGLHAVG
jgi:hypothetical protein